jgi:hypothetical protein
MQQGEPAMPRSGRFTSVAFIIAVLILALSMSAIVFGQTQEFMTKQRTLQPVSIPSPSRVAPEREGRGSPSAASGDFAVERVQ